MPFLVMLGSASLLVLVELCLYVFLSDVTVLAALFFAATVLLFAAASLLGVPLPLS